MKSGDLAAGKKCEEVVKHGPTEGQVNRLGDMLPQYYAARDCTVDGKIPQETRQRLSL